MMISLKLIQKKPLVFPHQTRWSESTEQLPAWIFYERIIIYFYQKAQGINYCYRSFSPFFTNHFKVHSRRYMICRKVACPGSKILPTIVAGALACENRPRRWQESPRITAWCLNKSTIQTQNLLSIHCPQLVLVRVSTWRSCMIGVVLIFQSLCQ